MHTLDRELHYLSSAAVGSLVSAECFTDVGQAVRGVPSALTRYFGFECPLGTTHPVADFYLRVSELGERGILAGASAEHRLPERLSGSPVWQQLRRFCEAWVDPGSPMAAELRQIWLEFDVSATCVVDAAVPSVFIMIHRHAGDGNAEQGVCTCPMLSTLLLFWAARSFRRLFCARCASVWRRRRRARTYRFSWV